MSAQTAPQLKDSNGFSLIDQHYDPFTDSYKPGSSLGTKLAGENTDFDWTKQEAGAIERRNVLPGQTDVVLGSIGASTDYLKRVSAVVSSSAASRVVIKDGLPSPKKALTTHASTASTTTTLNTAINTEAVTADQFKDHLVRVGTGPYRKILTHSAYAAGVVNSYNLDVALPAAPGTNVAIVIEFPDLVWEILPVGAAVDTHPLLIEQHCTGAGWRLSTDTGVSTFNNGDFDNV